MERSLPLGEIAKKIGVSSGDLADLNPELRVRATPSLPYSLRIPAGKGPQPTGLPAHRPSSTAYVLHSMARTDVCSWGGNSRYRSRTFPPDAGNGPEPAPVQE